MRITPKYVPKGRVSIFFQEHSDWTVHVERTPTFLLYDVNLSDTSFQHIKTCTLSIALMRTNSLLGILIFLQVAEKLKTGEVKACIAGVVREQI